MSKTGFLFFPILMLDKKNVAQFRNVEPTLVVTKK